MADPRAFLERWSRLKRSRPARPVADAPASETSTPVNAQPPELPPIESLTKDSDYTAFLRAGVPAATRNAALRKLWASDPVFANLDGLVEYGEDFGEPFRLGGVVATVYRALQGMPSGDEPTAQQPAEPAVASTDGAAPSPAATPSSPMTPAIEPAAEPIAADRGRPVKEGLG